MTPRVIASVALWPHGFTRMGRLVDREGAVVWRCIHRHRLIAGARECAEEERARWIADGRAAA